MKSLYDEIFSVSPLAQHYINGYVSLEDNPNFIKFKINASRAKIKYIKINKQAENLYCLTIVYEDQIDEKFLHLNKFQLMDLLESRTGVFFE